MAQSCPPTFTVIMIMIVIVVVVGLRGARVRAVVSGSGGHGVVVTRRVVLHTAKSGMWNPSRSAAMRAQS